MGYGDYLLFTAVANNLKKQKNVKTRYIRKKIIVKDDTQLGQGKIIKNNPNFCQIKNLSQCQDVKNITRENHFYNLNVNEHQIIQMCKKAGLKNNILLKPELYLLENEYKNVQKLLNNIKKPFIVLEPFSKKIRNEFFFILQKLVKDFKDKIQLVQIGAPTTQYYGKFEKNKKNLTLKLNNEILTINGKLTIRETIYFLQQSLCYIGIEGALVHGLASDIFYKKNNKFIKIVNKSTGIIFIGGQMNPKSVMYPQFEYIILDPHKGKYCGKLGLRKKDKGKCEDCCKMFKKYEIEKIYDKIDRLIRK